MSAKAFLDTNVLVYTFDRREQAKRRRARELVAAALRDGSGIISFQVVQEFLNVARKKFAVPMSTVDCSLYLEDVLRPLCQVHSSVELYEQALDVSERWQFSFFDSLIIAAALAGGCDVLYSEDLQHGQRIRELTIVDPFRSA